MAISKEHYVLVAKIMARMGESVRLYKDKPNGMSYKAAHIIWADAIRAMADTFSKDNRNFDRKAFYKECARLSDFEILWRTDDFDKVRF
jgi:hypothetical protein